MATAGDGFLRGAFDGCISGGDLGINRRPYHRNCTCALHKSRGNCSHSSRNTNVSYPIRRSFSEGCLMLVGNSSSPAVGGGISRTPSQLVLCKEDEEAEPSS